MNLAKNGIDQFGWHGLLEENGTAETVADGILGFALCSVDIIKNNGGKRDIRFGIG